MKFRKSLIAALLGWLLVASSIVMPSLYGIGTGLPVLLFALVLGFGAQALNPFFHRITRLETWARRVTGVVFIAVGMYYSLTYVFEVFA